MRLMLCLVAFLFPILAYGEIFYTHEKSNDLNSRDLYIDLIKKCVANTIYEDDSYRAGKTHAYSAEKRNGGRDWPSIAHTMVGVKRLDNIHDCLKEILEQNIPGDCIETGVWRGGSCILMRAILKAYNDTERKIWVADSFEGLPPPNVEKYPADRGLNLNKIKFLSVSLEQVQNNFKKYDLLDSQVVFLKGFFCDTLADAPIQQLALLRLDGDLFESTMDALVNLYPKLSPGGFVIIDDYGVIGACRAAVAQYRLDNDINEPIQKIDGVGVYWRKQL